MKRLLPLLWPFARLIPLHGPYLVMRRQWQYNQVWRHVLCEGAMAWAACGFVLWRIGRALELAGDLGPAIMAILGMALLWAGALAMLMVFFLLLLPFKHPDE